MSDLQLSASDRLPNTAWLVLNRCSKYFDSDDTALARHYFRGLSWSRLVLCAQNKQRSAPSYLAMCKLNEQARYYRTLSWNPQIVTNLAATFLMILTARLSIVLFKANISIIPKNFPGAINLLNQTDILWTVIRRQYACPVTVPEILLVPLPQNRF